MAHISTYSTSELLERYRKYKDELEAGLNKHIPHLFWFEKEAQRRGDKRFAAIYRAERERAGIRTVGSRQLMDLCREELVRRDPELWGNLAATVKSDLEQWKRPDLAYLSEPRP